MPTEPTTMTVRHGAHALAFVVSAASFVSTACSRPPPAVDIQPPPLADASWSGAALTDARVALDTFEASAPATRFDARAHCEALQRIAANADDSFMSVSLLTQVDAGILSTGGSAPGRLVPSGFEACTHFYRGPTKHPATSYTCVAAPSHTEAEAVALRDAIAASWATCLGSPWSRTAPLTWTGRPRDPRYASNCAVSLHDRTVTMKCEEYWPD